MVSFTILNTVALITAPHLDQRKSPLTYERLVFFGFFLLGWQVIFAALLGRQLICVWKKLHVDMNSACQPVVVQGCVRSVLWSLQDLVKLEFLLTSVN